jgi:hypothetical protein
MFHDRKLQGRTKHTPTFGVFFYACIVVSVIIKEMGRYVYISAIAYWKIKTWKTKQWLDYVATSLPLLRVKDGGTSLNCNKAGLMVRIWTELSTSKHTLFPMELVWDWKLRCPSVQTHLRLLFVLSHIPQWTRSFTNAILIFMRPFLCNASCIPGNAILGVPVTFKCKTDVSGLLDTELSHTFGTWAIRSTAGTEYVRHNSH